MSEDPSKLGYYQSYGLTHIMRCRSGTFKQPLFAADGSTVNGIETIDGTKYYADKVVIAAGAWTSTLVDLEDQCVSKVCLKLWLRSKSSQIQLDLLLLIKNLPRPGYLLTFNLHRKKWKSTRTFQ